MEDNAESERFYAPTIIPGMLQAQAYAQEIIRTGFLVVPPGEIERRVLVRVTRQHVLNKDNPLEFNAVLDEATLRRQVGGPNVMKEQLSHLVEMATRPNVDLQVLPFAKGSHPAMQGGFAILQFPEVAASDVVYLENMTSDLFIESEREVYQYSLVFDHLRELALAQEESIALITQIAKKIE